MLKKRFFIPVVVAIALLFTGPAFAGGWGPYFSWTRDWPSTGFDDAIIDEALKSAGGWLTPAEIASVRSSMQAAEVNYTQDHLSFGVIYDSSPSFDQLFNFRMTLGADFAVNGKTRSVNFPPTGNALLDTYIQDSSGYVGSILDSTGYGGTMKFTFGFAPIRTELLKWWVGPCIRINGNYYNLDITVPAIGTLKHGGTISAGGGVETGVNFHVLPWMSVGVTAGFLWNAYGLGAGVESSTGSIDSGTFVWGNGPMVVMQVSCLFHTGDDRKAW